MICGDPVVSIGRGLVWEDEEAVGSNPTRVTAQNIVRGVQYDGPSSRGERRQQDFSTRPGTLPKKQVYDRANVRKSGLGPQR